MQCRWRDLHALSPVRDYTRTIERSTPAFRQTTLALFAAGFSTFALMYCVQPLLPELARSFGVSAATSSLAVSMTTGALAATLLLSGSLSERVARKSMIVASLCTTAVLTMLCATAASWTMFLVVRVLAGIAFAGLPAIAVVYVGEEIARRAAGLAMGIYVAGTAVGGMSGRLLAAALTDAFGWRVAVGATGALGVGVAVLVAVLLPRAQHVRPGALATESLLAVHRAHIADPHLRNLFVQGFLYMGAFVAIYNYLAFRLLAPPYMLGHAVIGSVFLLYLVGMVSSPWAGLCRHAWTPAHAWIEPAPHAGGRCAHARDAARVVILGVGLLTFGFFAAHAVTTPGSVPARRAPGAGLLAVRGLLLHWRERDRILWRRVLDPLRLERCRRVRADADGCGARDSQVD